MNEAKLIAFVAYAFKNKTDKGGVAYIRHCLYVADEARLHAKQYTDSTAVLDIIWEAGLGHDLIEDCGLTLLDLWEAGFSDEASLIIDVFLTKKKDVLYEDYIDNIATRAFTSGFAMAALFVKRLDLRHNSDVMRLKPADRCTPNTEERVKKYRNSLEKLNLNGLTPPEISTILAKMCG